MVAGVNPARGAASVPACPCGCGLSRWPRRRGLPGLVAPGLGRQGRMRRRRLPVRGHQPISPIYSEPVPLLSETAQFRNFWRLPHVSNPPESSRTLVASFRNRPIPNNIFKTRTCSARGLTLYRQARTVNPINPTKKGAAHDPRQRAPRTQPSRSKKPAGSSTMRSSSSAYAKMPTSGGKTPTGRRLPGSRTRHSYRHRRQSCHWAMSGLTL